MSDKILVRIEYNELEGDLHYEQNRGSEQGDNSYKTISDRVDSDLAYEFSEVIDMKYPDLGGSNEGQNPSFAQMEIEFQNFIVAKKSNLT